MKNITNHFDYQATMPQQSRPVNTNQSNSPKKVAYFWQSNEHLIHDYFNDVKTQAQVLEKTNQLITRCNKNLDNAMELFKNVKEAGITPDHLMYTQLIAICSENLNAPLAENLRLEFTNLINHHNV